MFIRDASIHFFPFRDRYRYLEFSIDWYQSDTDTETAYNHLTNYVLLCRKKSLFVVGNIIYIMYFPNFLKTNKMIQMYWKTFKTVCQYSNSKQTNSFTSFVKVKHEKNITTYLPVQSVQLGG